MSESTRKYNKKFRKYIETNENENTRVQNIWDTAKAVLRGKFIVTQTYLEKQEEFEINNQILHLKELEKEKQTKPNTSTRKKIIKIRAEINDIKTKTTTTTETIEQMNKTRSWFFEKSIKLMNF